MDSDESSEIINWTDSSSSFVQNDMVRGKVPSIKLFFKFNEIKLVSAWKTAVGISPEIWFDWELLNYDFFFIN